MILHIVKRGDWEQAVIQGIYAPDSLRSEGFVHCSTAPQVVQTAQRFFRAEQDLLLLAIDDQRLPGRVRWEAPAHPASGPGELFPHVYGPIDLHAVVQICEFPCEVDGSFRLPRELEA